MRRSISSEKTGIQWTFTSHIGDLYFADDNTLYASYPKPCIIYGGKRKLTDQASKAGLNSHMMWLKQNKKKICVYTKRITEPYRLMEII